MRREDDVFENLDFIRSPNVNYDLGAAYRLFMNSYAHISPWTVKNTHVQKVYGTDFKALQVLNTLHFALQVSLVTKDRTIISSGSVGYIKIEMS